MFVRLKDWDERDAKTGTSFAIIERATKAFNRLTKRASSPAARRQSAAGQFRRF
jgi:multidrug efflux pump